MLDTQSKQIPEVDGLLTQGLTNLNLNQHASKQPDSSVLNQALNNTCDYCRLRKIKCDSGKPSCSYCRNKNKHCTYSINKKKQMFIGTPLTLSLEKLEERIKNLEGLSLEIASHHQVCYSNQSFQNPAVPTGSSLPNEFLYSDFVPMHGSNPATNSDFTLTSMSAASPNSSGQKVAGYNNFNINQFLLDPYGIEDLRRLLLASYQSKAENKGFANHHKQVLIDLCLKSNMVMAAFCAVSCAHAHFAFLDHTPNTRRRLIDHFLSHAKSLLLSQGYVSPSIATVQTLVLIAIVEYERGSFSRAIMYTQSALSMALTLNMHQLDKNRMGQVTYEGAAFRKVWWEIVTIDRCSPLMLYPDGSIIQPGFQVMLADAFGNSMGFTFEELTSSHAHRLLSDPDPTIRLLPVVRLKIADLLLRAHVIAQNEAKSPTPESENQALMLLRKDMSEWAYFASPNPFLPDALPQALAEGVPQPIIGEHPTTQASLILLFNCAYILAYCPSLYSADENSSIRIPDSCGVAAAHLITAIGLSKPEEPRGEGWHQILPFFAYIGCLTYSRLFDVYSTNKAARMTAQDRFECLYMELAATLPRFAVSDLFMAKLRPSRARMMEADPIFS